MTKSFSIICALVTTFIWGTAFIAQDTGMDNIGPLTFNAARFLVGFITILPFALFFYGILCSISSNITIFYILTKSTLEYLALNRSLYIWSLLIK